MSDHPTTKRRFTMPNLDTTQARRVIVLITAAVVALLGLTKIKPNFDQAKTQKEQVTTTENEIAKLNRDYRALTRTQNDDLARTLVVALPTSVDFDTEYNRLNRLANKVGARLTAGEQSSEPTAQGSYQKMNVTLRLSCQYSACLRFLGGMQGMVRTRGEKSLEVHGPIWSVEQLQLAPGETIQLSLNAAIFLAPNASQPDASGATPAPTTTQPSS